MKSLLYANKSKLNLELLQGFLSDHGNSSDNICWHADPNSNELGRIRTYDSYIFVSEKKEAWVANGNPCENAYIKYQV